MKIFTLAPSRILFLCAIMLAGCTHSSLRSTRAVLPTLPLEIANDFSYSKTGEFDAQIETIEETPRYRARRVTLKAGDAAPGDERRIVTEFYSVRTGEKAPVVLVLPMSGGGYGLERHFAAYYANRGYSAVIVHRDKLSKEQQAIENLDPMIHRMILDHRRVIDWLETQPEVDARKVGLFGISMGGIKGAMLAPLEGRIGAAVLGLAGGDLPHILAHSTESGVTRRREEFLKAHSLSPEQAEAELRKILKRDPLLYAPYVDPKRVLLVLARYDTVVPIAKGFELKERMGNPETIVIPAGHYSAVLSIPYIKSESFEFMAKRFGEMDSMKPGKATGGLARTERRGR